MATKQYSKQKKPLKCSKKQIDKAAQKIRHGIENGEERTLAIEAIQNYREFHLYPLMLLKNHLVRTSNKVNKDITVTRRLKRLPTIINKLERPSLDGESKNAIKLTRMQDIAGCRAIVGNLDELIQLQERLLASRSVHRIVRTNNYLVPKRSGYGGIHLIYSCYEGQEEKHDWKGAKVEVQLRTELQHAWATSLEIIDTLENIDLKTSHLGHEKWREYFSLLGKLVAHSEGADLLDKNELLDVRKKLFGCPQLLGEKAQGLHAELSVVETLDKYVIAMAVSTGDEAVELSKKKSGMFLIKIYPKVGPQEEGKIEYELDLKFYSNDKSDEAVNEYNKSELDENIFLTVLVSGSGTKSLAQAYPNYFGSTNLLREFMIQQTNEYKVYINQATDLFKLKGELLAKLFERSKRNTFTAAKILKLLKIMINYVKVAQPHDPDLAEGEKLYLELLTQTKNATNDSFYEH